MPTTGWPSPWSDAHGERAPSGGEPRTTWARAWQCETLFRNVAYEHTLSYLPNAEM